MSKVERIEYEIKQLSPEELAEFRDWFVTFDWDAWDRQLERDAATGRLDALADEALREHAAGNTKPV